MAPTRDGTDRKIPHSIYITQSKFDWSHNMGVKTVPKLVTVYHCKDCVYLGFEP